MVISRRSGAGCLVLGIRGGILGAAGARAVVRPGPRPGGGAQRGAVEQRVAVHGPGRGGTTADSIGFSVAQRRISPTFFLKFSFTLSLPPSGRSSVT